MFSKRHYEFLARFMCDQISAAAGEPLVYELAKDLADTLARDNGRFDRERFLLACCDTVADRNRLLGR